MSETRMSAGTRNHDAGQFSALRYFMLDGTTTPAIKSRASMIRRYITQRNNHAYDERLRRIAGRANVA